MNKTNINFYYNLLRVVSNDNYFFKKRLFDDGIFVREHNYAPANYNSFTFNNLKTVKEVVVMIGEDWFFFKEQDRANSIRKLNSEQEILEIFKAWHNKIKNLENFE